MTTKKYNQAIREEEKQYILDMVGDMTVEEFIRSKDTIRIPTKAETLEILRSN